MLLSTALFIGALDVEEYILSPLGIKMPECVYTVASAIPNFYVGFLLLWGALHLKNGKTTFKQVIYLGTIVIISYVWLFLLAINAFGDNFIVNSSVPSFVFGGAMMYTGYVLWNNVVSTRFFDRLFPAGLLLVGALNLTYPIGRPIEWYATFAFFTAAVGRVLAAVGATMFVFFSIVKPMETPTKAKSIPPGAYLVQNEKELNTKLPSLFENDLIAVTRTEPEKAAKKFSPGSLIFWLTKVKDGQVQEMPRIMALSPTKLGILQDLIAKELESGYDTLYIDAFEYLKSEVGFPTAVRFLLAVKDMVRAKNGRLVLIVDMKALEEKERKILEREFSF